MNATTLLFKRDASMSIKMNANFYKNILAHGFLSMLMLLTPMHLANAKTIDNLSVGDKDEKVFINTDQLMTKDGSVIKNLDVVQEAFNTSSATDNIKVCRQSNTAICKLRLRERMPAVMHFNEDVKSFVLGDGLNFAFSSVDGSRKIYKLEGYYPGADTNLTIVGESGLIYSFYIRIDSVSSKFVSDFVVNVRGNPMLISSSKIALKNQQQRAIDRARARDINNPLNLYANNKFSNNGTVNNDYLNSPSVNNAYLHNTYPNNYPNNTYLQVNQAQHRQSPPRVYATPEVLENTEQQRIRTPQQLAQQTTQHRVMTTQESQDNKQRLRTTQQALENTAQHTVRTTQPILDYLDSKPNITIQDLDFNFKIINGDKALMPKSVFDDGTWTYWQYGNNNLDAVDKLPVPYAVVDGHDMPLNSRVEGGYLITEGISKRWTLRSGESYACVSKFE